MKEVKDGTVIKVQDYIKYKDIDNDGEEITLLSIRAITDNEDQLVIVTQSDTFMKAFEDALEYIEEGEEMCIQKQSGESKAGRPYVTCFLL
ncbi:MAG: hypothetical protein NC311_10785 [Muribaculaceae bacterium]|nr:hypothetical protein [Muribaculaceae bacterium]